MGASHGWYPDPERQGMLRGWNGDSWLDHWQPDTAPAITEADQPRPPSTSLERVRPGRRLSTGALTLALIGLLVLGALVFNASPGTQPVIARDLMLKACLESVAIQSGSPVAQVTGTLTDSSPFSHDVRFAGRYAGGAWECWGSLEDNELGIHYRFDPALPVPAP